MQPLFDSALTAALLALVVWFVTRRFRLRPELRHALWLIVLVRLILPPVVSWPGSLEGAWSEVARTWEESSPAAWPAPAAAESAPPAPVFGPAAPAYAPLAPVPHGGPGLAFWLGLAWLVGGLVSAAGQVTALARVRARARAGARAPAWFEQEVTELAGRMGVRPPRVSVVAGAASPLVFGGGRRAVLCWPAALLTRWGRDRSRPVIVHELAHLRRRDPWTGWVELVATSLWWWNPLVHLARRELAESAELACDAWVLRLLPERRRHYAEALLDVAESRTTPHRPHAVLSTAGGPRRSLERRLTMIMQHNPSPIRSGRSGRIGVLVVLALAAIAVPCVAWTSHDRLGLEFLGGHTVRFAGHGVDAVGQLRRHLQDHLKGHATDDERWETELEQRLELDRSVKLLRLSTNAGSLAVIPTEGEQVVVRARVTADLDRVDAAECTEVFADHVQVESGEGRLNVSDARSHAGRETKGWSVSLEISLPRALALDVSAGAGSIVVKAATGEVRLKSGAGRIELNTAGRLERLEIGSQAGGVKADVGGVQGEVEVLVGAGAIELSLGHKGSSGDLTVTTRAGGVSVTLPRDVSGHFSMSTPAGSISVDEVFGLEVQRKFASSRCEGQVGASKARLTIESGAGSIELESKETGLVY